MGLLSHDYHVSQSHFSVSQWLVLRNWVCVLLFSCLSLGNLLSRRVTLETRHDQESRSSFFVFGKIYSQSTILSICIMMRVLTDGCGDYRWVWCVAFFSEPSTLAVTFGPYQWMQLVDRISALTSFRSVLIVETSHGDAFCQSSHTDHHSEHRFWRAQRCTCQSCFTHVVLSCVTAWP